MTTYERGDVVEATDPFTDINPSRPFLIVNTAAHPFHGDQYVAITLTTRRWYDETIPLDEDEFVEGGVPEGSFIVRWGVVSLHTRTSSTGSGGSTRRLSIELSSG